VKPRRRARNKTEVVGRSAVLLEVQFVRSEKRT
jgi:hypothetical protein